MLALISGNGDLPRLIAAAQSEPPLVCALEGHRPAGLDVDHRFRLETFGSLLLWLGEQGVTEVCLCGSIDRPAIDPSALDAETAPLVPLILEALRKGDDGALRIILQLFEQTGFTIRAAHDLLPMLLPPGGVLSARHPRDAHRADADAARAVLAEMGAIDLGQACVIRKGRVLIRETDTGTDAMLAALALPGLPTMPEAGDFDAHLLTLAKAELHEAPGAGAILFKAPKPDQDRRVDLPTIGPSTALNAARAGLDGVVIEKGGVMVLGLPQVIAILDAMEMFLWVRP